MAVTGPLELTRIGTVESSLNPIGLQRQCST